MTWDQQPTNLDQQRGAHPGGNLLRMFQSEQFECHLHMYYLNSRKESGVHDYLVELLYKRPDNEVHFYLPQLCQLACSRANTSLPRFLLDKSASSMHLALKANWIFQAAFEDGIPGLSKTANSLKEEIEMAVVNSKPFSTQRALPDTSTQQRINDLFLRRRLVGFLSRYRTRNIEELVKSCLELLHGPNGPPVPVISSSAVSLGRKARILPGYMTFGNWITVPGAKVKLPTIYQKIGTPFQYTSFAKEYHGVLHNNFELQPWIAPQRRCEYFNTLDRFITMIIEVSNKLTSEPDRKIRSELVKKFLECVDEWIFCRRCTVAASEGIFGMTGIALPFNKFSNTSVPAPEFLVRPTSCDKRNKSSSIGNPLQLIRIVVDEAKVFSSRKRAPYLLVFELGDLDEDLQDIDQDQLRVVLDIKQRQAQRAQKGNPKPPSFRRGDTVVIKTGLLSDDEEENEDKEDRLKDSSLDGSSKDLTSPKNDVKTAPAMPESFVSNAEEDVIPPPTVPDTGTTATSSVPENLTYEEEMEIINQFKFEWSDMYVYEGITQTLHERELFIPPFLNRPLTKDEWACISDSRLRIVSCGHCMPNQDRPKQMSNQSAAAVAQHYAGCPFICQICNGTALYYNSIINESLVDPIKRSLGIVPPLVGPDVTVSPYRRLSPRRVPSDAIGSGDFPARRRRGSSTTSPSINEDTTGSLVRSASTGRTSPMNLPSAVPEFRSTPKMSDMVASPPQISHTVGALLDSSSVDDGASSPARSTPAVNTTNLFTSSESMGLPLEQPIGQGSADQMDTSLGRRSGDLLSSGTHPLKIEGESIAQQSRRVRRLIWGELWAEKVERIRRESPFGKLKTWRCGAVMVKGGDDVRQELLASQLIQLVNEIFKRADLPLWLYPYEILITGANCGIIEFVPDTQSIDSIKQKFGVDGINKVFDVAFGDNIELARKNFIESHAAYSLISYILQVKDRHNGNLLLTAEGRLIHIDYGFMLTNCPGYVNFETSPFKLSAELMAIMQGPESDHFEYFKELMVKGFCELRKYYERLLLLIEMMFSASKMPCFSGNPEAALAVVKEKFMMNASHGQCTSKVLELIDLSVNNWRTQQYDNFQRFTNGIL